MKILLQRYSSMDSTGPRDPSECTKEFFQILSSRDPLLARAKELIQEGIDIHGVDEHGSTLVCAATISGSYEILKLLITKDDCDIDIEKPDHSGQTPLHWAAIKGHCSVGQLLIDSKADPNINDTEYRTPLHWAVLQGHTEFVRVLMRAGADANLTDEEGQTPLNLSSGKILDTIQEFQKLQKGARTPRGGGDQSVTKDEPEDQMVDNTDNLPDSFAISIPADKLDQNNTRRENDNDDDDDDDCKTEECNREQQQISTNTDDPDEINVEDAMKATIGELIRNAVKSARITDHCTDPEKAEEIITATVDVIINRVQNQAEEILDKTLDYLANFSNSTT